MRDAEVSAEQFSALFRAVSSWGRWGTEDERGALHHLTPQRVAAAVRLVRDGISVTLSLPLNTRPAVDNPKPADHYMTELDELDPGPGSLHFNKDYVGLDHHNDDHTHIDARATSPAESNRDLLMASGHRIELAHATGLRAWVLHDDAADLHATWSR